MSVVCPMFDTKCMHCAIQDMGWQRKTYPGSRGSDRGRRTQVVEEARPLVVGGSVGEGRLGHEFVRLVVQVVV